MQERYIPPAYDLTFPDIAYVDWPGSCVCGYAYTPTLSRYYHDGRPPPRVLVGGLGAGNHLVMSCFMIHYNFYLFLTRDFPLILGES